MSWFRSWLVSLSVWWNRDAWHDIIRQHSLCVQDSPAYFQETNFQRNGDAGSVLKEVQKLHDIHAEATRITRRIIMLLSPVHVAEAGKNSHLQTVEVTYPEPIFSLKHGAKISTQSKLIEGEQDHEAHEQRMRFRTGILLNDLCGDETMKEFLNYTQNEFHTSGLSVNVVTDNEIDGYVKKMDGENSIGQRLPFFSVDAEEQGSLLLALAANDEKIVELNTNIETTEIATKVKESNLSIAPNFETSCIANTEIRKQERLNANLLSPSHQHFSFPNKVGCEANYENRDTVKYFEYNVTDQEPTTTVEIETVPDDGPDLTRTDRIANHNITFQQFDNVTEHLHQPLSMPNSTCSFGVCVDKINLYTAGRGNYHLISATYPLSQPTVVGNEDPDIFWTGRCKLGIVISTMPHAGAELQMALVKTLIQQLGFTFGGYVYWNFHAHANIQGENLLQWIAKFNNWVSNRKSREYIVIRAPYSDDMNAMDLCASSIVVNGHRSLLDIASLNYKAEIDLGGKVMTNREIVDHTRSFLLHHKRWSVKANFNPDYKKFVKVTGMRKFIVEMCSPLSGIWIGQNSLCMNDDLLDRVLDSAAVKMEVAKLRKMEMVLSQARESLDDDIVQVDKVTESYFQSWIDASPGVRENMVVK